MKKLIMFGLMLSLTASPGVVNNAAAATVKTIKTAGVNGTTNNQLLLRLKEIREIAEKGNLTGLERTSLKKEALSIHKQIKNNDPTIVISLSAAIVIAIIIVLLATPRHHNAVIVS